MVVFEFKIRVRESIPHCLEERYRTSLLYFKQTAKMAPIIFLAKPGQVFECPFECRSPMERFWTLGCWNNNRCVSVRRVMSVREAYRVLYSIPLSYQILRGHLDRQNI